MAMTYSTLIADKSTVGSIKRWINYDLIPSEEVIEDAQAFIYSQLRVREMTTTSQLTFEAGTVGAALPTRFLDPITMRDHFGNEIVLRESRDHYIDEQTLDGAFTDNVSLLEADLPTSYSLISSAGIIFDVTKSSAGNATLLYVYYAAPALLAETTNETNFLTTRYPHILRNTALGFGYLFRKDDESAERHLKMATALIESANAESDLSRRGARYNIT